MERLERLSLPTYNPRMPFPLSVSDMWKMFELANGQEAKNKRVVCEWLDAVYTDLEDLSKVWLKICASLESAEDEKEIARALKIINRGGGTSQTASAGRLIAFYESASGVLGYKRRTDFIEKLSTVLSDRAQARIMPEKDLGRDSLNPQSATQRLIQMRAFAQAIQQDVVSLQILIKTFKTQG